MLKRIAPVVAVALTLYFVSVTPAVAFEVEDKAAKKVTTVTVMYYLKYDRVCLKLPASLSFEIPVRLLDHTEIEKTGTNLWLKGESVEIYPFRVRKDKKDVAPTSLVVQDMQVGPGFIANPEWKIVVVRHGVPGEVLR